MPELGDLLAEEAERRTPERVPPFEVIRARSVRRQPYRRVAVAAGAAAAVTVVVLGSVAVGEGRRGGAPAGGPTSSSSPAPSIVPWVDRPAPVPTQPPATSARSAQYPRCTTGQLQASAVTGGPAAGTMYQRVWLTNHSSKACTLAGQPAAAFAVHPDGSRTRLAPSNAVGENLIGPGPANLAPGQRGGVTAAFSDHCTAAEPVNTVTAIVLTLDDGGHLRADLPSPLAPTCPPGDISPFGAAPPPASSDTSPLNALRATLNAPQSVTAGQPLTYTVTLTNTSSSAVALSPCPSYAESLVIPGTDSPGPNRTARYYLNCDAVDAIPTGDAVTFAMRMDNPSTETGPAKLDWQLSNSNVATATAITLLPGSTAAPDSPAAAGCTMKQLHVTFVYGGLGAGNSIGALEVRNTTAQPCALTGTVTVEALDVDQHALTLSHWRNRTTASMTLDPHGQTYARVALMGEYRDDFRTNALCAPQHETTPAYWKLTTTAGTWTVPNQDPNSPNGGNRASHTGPGVQACRGNFAPVRINSAE